MKSAVRQRLEDKAHAPLKPGTGYTYDPKGRRAKAVATWTRSREIRRGVTIILLLEEQQNAVEFLKGRL